MDIVFHTTAAVVLARHLGERRMPALIWAAIIGANADIGSIIGYSFLPRAIIYPLFHSLLVQVLICLIILFINRRIAFGGLLHVLTDAISHKYTTKHLFHPFWHNQIPGGVTWHDADGICVWIMLWILLLLIIYREYQEARRWNDNKPAQGGSPAEHADKY